MSMNQRTIIGLTGRAGAGKSTVAAYLEHEWAMHQIAFAEPIQSMLCQLFSMAGIDGAWTADRTLKELPTTLGWSYRHLAQSLGTEWARHQLADDFWLRVAGARIDAPLMQAEHVVISDVRFPNEAEWVRARGGVIVQVLREGLPSVRQHESERHADSITPDTELLNFGSLATLHDQIDRMVGHLLRKHRRSAAS